MSPADKAALISTISAIVSILLYLRTYRIHHQMREQTVYQNIDQQYNEWLKLGMQNPQFFNKEKTKNYKGTFSPSQALEYELFAYVLWNICETTFDGRDRRKFWKTWKSIIPTAYEFHGIWFDDPNKTLGKFNKDFIKYVQKTAPRKKEGKFRGWLSWFVRQLNVILNQLQRSKKH